MAFLKTKVLFTAFSCVVTGCIKEKNGHARGYAGGYLLKDYAFGAIGDIRGDFEAPVHGAGVHDQRAGLGALKAAGG